MNEAERRALWREWSDYGGDFPAELAHLPCGARRRAGTPASDATCIDPAAASCTAALPPTYAQPRASDAPLATENGQRRANPMGGCRTLMI